MKISGKAPFPAGAAAPAMPLRRRLAAVSGLLLSTLFGAVACGDASGTGGRAVFYEVAVTAPPELSDGSFETALGWEVELDEAVIALGPIYLWESAPVGASADDPGATGGPDGLLSYLGPLGYLRPPGDPGPLGFLSEVLVPTAHAHPGDNQFDGGEIRGEILGQWAVPLLDPAPLVLGEARGIAGEVRSVSVVLDPAGPTTRGDAASSLGAHQAHVRGRARKDGQEVPFVGDLRIPDEGLQRQVDGIAAKLELDDAGRLTLEVDPRAWFDAAHFDRLPDESEADASGDYVIDARTQVRNAWFAGIRSPRSFRTVWGVD